MGSTEIILIIAVVFVLFGASLVPKVFSNIKKTKKAIKDGIEDLKNDEEA